MLTIEELSKHTGLSINFLRKCQNKIGDILMPYIKRGNKNKLLFDNNAIAIFNEIRHMKEKGFSIPDIKKGLENSLNSNKTKSSSLSQTENNIELYERIIELEKRHAADQLEWEKERLDKAHALETLKNELKFLPEGKSIKELNNDYFLRQKELLKQEKQKTERLRILGSLKNLGIFSYKKKQNLLNELEKLN